MTRPHPAADRGTYIGLLREGLLRESAEPRICCADRPAGRRAYRCTCGQRWQLGHDGWFKIGLAADGDRISIRHAAREA